MERSTRTEAVAARAREGGHGGPGRRRDVRTDPDHYRRSIRGWLNRRRYEHAMRVVALRPGDRILDLGCGNGLKSVAAWNHRDPVTGVDRLRRDRVLPMHPNFHYLRLDVRDLSTIVADSFDVVTSFGLLEHLDDEETAAILHESRRIATRWVHVVPHRLAFVEPHVRLPLFGAWPHRLQLRVMRWRRRGRPQDRPLGIWWRSTTRWRALAGDPGVAVARHWYGPFLVSALVHGGRRPPA